MSIRILELNDKDWAVLDCLIRSEVRTISSDPTDCSEHLQDIAELWIKLYNAVTKQKSIVNKEKILKIYFKLVNILDGNEKITKELPELSDLVNEIKQLDVR
jgi:spermidine/putrescine-binding protein